MNPKLVTALIAVVVIAVVFRVAPLRSAIVGG